MERLHHAYHVLYIGSTIGHVFDTDISHPASRFRGISGRSKGTAILRLLIGTEKALVSHYPDINDGTVDKWRGSSSIERIIQILHSNTLKKSLNLGSE